MICKNCGSQVPEGAKFCIYCGTRVSDESVEYKEEVIYDVPEEEREAAQSAADKPGTAYTYGSGPQTYQADYQPKKKSSGKAPIIIAIAFVVVLMLIAAMVKIGLGLFAGNSGSYTEDPAQTETTVTQFTDTDVFCDFMMGEWTTKLGGNYFEVSEDEEYYYYETDLYIENDATHSWYVVDNVMYVCYTDDENDPGQPYLYFAVRDNDTVEIYCYDNGETKVFHRR